MRFGIPPDGYWLPADTRLGPVSLQVSDLRRSLTYYEQILGLRAATRGADTATLSPQNDGRPLVRLFARAGLRPLPRRGALGLYHFAILVPERAALGRFVAHLTSLGVDAGTADHSVSEAVYLSDPDGLAEQAAASLRNAGYDVAERAGG